MYSLYPPVIQHMKDVSENDEAFLARVVAYAERLEEEHRRISKKLEEGTLHVPFCNGDHSKRVGTEGMICNCPLGHDIHRLQHLVKRLSEDKVRLDRLEALLKKENHLSLSYEPAWAKVAVTGSILSQGPEAFRLKDDTQPEISFRRAIDALEL